MRSAVIVSLILCGVAAVAAGCSQRDSAPPPPTLIETGAWRIEAMRQRGVMRPTAAPASLALSQGVFEADAGCGPIRGRYALENTSKLRFTDVRAPRDPDCAAPAVAQQADLVAVLNKVGRWEAVGDGVLTLSHGAGVALMQVRR